MNPHLEATFATEPDLYCAPGVECDVGRESTHIVLTADELLTILQDHARRSPAVAYGIQSALKDTAASAWVNHIGPVVNKPGTVPAGLLAADAQMLAVTARTVYTGQPLKVIFSNRDVPVLKRIVETLAGSATKVTLRTTPKGVQMISLSGYAGLRLLNGTRYLASNPRILKLGLGTQGLKAVARSSFVTATVVSSTVEVCNWYFTDSATVADLVGGVGVELIKNGIVLGITYLAGATVVALAGATTFVAILPLGVMIAVSFIAGWKLNELDSERGWKTDVQQWLNNLPQNMPEGWYRLDQKTMVRIGEIREAYEVEIQRLKKQTQQRIGQTIENAAIAAAEMALKALKRKVEDEVRQLLGPRVR